MRAVGRGGATLGELPGTGRPGGHLQTLLGSKETAFWLVSGQWSDQEVWAPSSPLYFCFVPDGVTDNTLEAPASTWNQGQHPLRNRHLS